MLKQASTGHRGVRVEVADREGAEPRMSIQGCLSRQPHKQRNESKQTKDRAVEMLKARTAGQRQARQTMECKNNQANGQVIAQPPPHWMRAEIAGGHFEMSQSGICGRRRKMKRGNNRSINQSINQSTIQPINRSMYE